MVLLANSHEPERSAVSKILGMATGSVEALLRLYYSPLLLLPQTSSLLWPSPPGADPQSSPQSTLYMTISESASLVTQPATGHQAIKLCFSP